MLYLTDKMRVIVFDGSRAILLRKQGEGAAHNLVTVRAEEQKHAATHDLGTDQPGRTNDSTGRRSAMEATDLHQIAEDQFIKRLATSLTGEIDRGEYEGLVVVAPPVALGVFRKQVGPALRRAIIAEIDKDLTGHTVADIGKLVIKALEQ